MVKTDARSYSCEAQEVIRIKAVQAVESGKTQLEVAKVFGVTRQVVGKWVKAYREGGIRALKAKKRGRRKGGSLLGWQAAQIARTVTDRQPEQLHFPFHLWTRDGVALLIEARFGIQLSKWTVGRYLKRWGFSPQKPLRRAYEQNPEAVRHWLESRYPAIHRQAKQEKALIFWGDEMGLRSDHAAGRTYGRKGSTPVVPGTGKRFGCNMISAITNRGHLNFMVFKERFTAPVFIEFMHRLVRQTESWKVFLIVDNHPVHHSNIVTEWVEKNGGRIRLFFLPSYSPELNPDELLNQDVKANASGRMRAKAQAELIQNVRCFLRKRQWKPDLVCRYFNENHVHYAAA